MAGEEGAAGEGGGLLLEIVGSPLNLSLLGLCLFLLYQILRGERPSAPSGEADPPPLPKMKRRDFTLEQLRPFDGVSDPRILMAVNGKVFDVTRARKFYGPGEGGRGRGLRGAPSPGARRVVPEASGRGERGAGQGRCWPGAPRLSGDQRSCLTPCRPSSLCGGLERAGRACSREGCAPLQRCERGVPVRRRAA